MRCFTRATWERKFSKANYLFSFNACTFTSFVYASTPMPIQCNERKSPGHPMCHEHLTFAACRLGPPVNMRTQRLCSHRRIVSLHSSSSWNRSKLYIITTCGTVENRLFSRCPSSWCTCSCVHLSRTTTWALELALGTTCNFRSKADFVHARTIWGIQSIQMGMVCRTRLC
jgi:hypothetical protein